MTVDKNLLEEQLKDFSFFKTMIKPVQFLQLMAQMFLLFAIPLVIMFLGSALWHAVQGTLFLSENYQVLFNAKIGGGFILFLFAIAACCNFIAKKNRNRLFYTLHQAYLNNPKVYIINAVLRRKDVVLCAYATNPQEQKDIEHLLIQEFAINSKSYEHAYDRIATVSMKHKGIKMDALKKSIMKNAPILAGYTFYLNSFKLPEKEGNASYYIVLQVEKGLLPMYAGYTRLLVL